LATFLIPLCSYYWCELDKLHLLRNNHRKHKSCHDMHMYGMTTTTA
jgi:hypothetical protein